MTHAPVSTSAIEQRETDDKSPILISVISQSRLLREGLIALIHPHLNVSLAGGYTGNADPATVTLNPLPQVVLIDGGLGQEVAARWTRWWRDHAVQVLILEVDDNKDVILACIEAGANGYTLKETPPAEVAQVIERAKHGQAVCSPEITAHIFARLAALKSADRLPPMPLIPLTARELEVLHCVARGLSNKEIAAALTIEIHTVKHHVHNILEKLRMSHRRDAARFALEQGWLNAPYFPKTYAD